MLFAPFKIFNIVYSVTYKLKSLKWHGVDMSSMTLQILFFFFKLLLVLVGFTDSNKSERERDMMETQPLIYQDPQVI